MDLKEDIFEKAKNFLLNPKAAFDAESKSSVIDAIKYSFIWLFIVGILSAIVTGIFGNMLLKLVTTIPGGVEPTITAGMIITTFISSWIGGIIVLLILGVWLHIWAYLLGAKQKLENTIKIVLYGNTPSYVLGWIPFASTIGGIWSLILYVLGLNRLQKMSMGKAVGALVLAIVIPAVILLIFAYTVFTSFSNIMALGPI